MRTNQREAIDLVNTVSLEDFVEDLERSGLIPDIRQMVRPEVLLQWLSQNSWVVTDKACRLCQNKPWFDEAKCGENLDAGGTCYRETIQSLMPVAELMLTGRAPRIRELGKTVHLKGPVHHDGYGNGKDGKDTLLRVFIHHELRGVSMSLPTKP